MFKNFFNLFSISKIGKLNMLSVSAILFLVVGLIILTLIFISLIILKKGRARSAQLIEAEIKNTYKLLEGKMVDEAAKKYELLKKYYKDYAENIPYLKRRKLYTQILKLYNAITSNYK